MQNRVRILAIESSCDETAAAVIFSDGKKLQILSNVISSQVDLHAKTGGVVPEVASRAHMEAIIPVVTEALLKTRQESSSPIAQMEIAELNEKYQEAIALLDDITHIAVTAGPGLIGSLLVGFNAAKTIAYAKNIPIIPVNHIEGHIYSALGGEFSNFHFPIAKQILNSDRNQTIFPVVALTVSGGHTSLTLIRDHLDYEPIGSTLDDAAGEAFDKVAKLLDLGYPGGPEVSKHASQFRDNITIKQYNNKTSIIFPRPIINDGTFNFSFSGLKTAVLTKLKSMMADGSQLTQMDKEEICFAFEEAAVDVLCTKTIRAAQKYCPKAILLAGGVSANRRLQEELKSRIEIYNADNNEKNKMNFYMPPAEMMGDNAAMIGLAAYSHILKNDTANWSEIKVDSNLKLG